MKISKLIGFLALGWIFSTLTSIATADQKRPILPQNPRSTLQPKQESIPVTETTVEPADEDLAWGLGGTTWGSAVSPTPLSLWLDLNEWNSVQLALGLNGLVPFDLHTGAAYRLTLEGDSTLGFHVGLGAQFLMSFSSVRFGFDLHAIPLFGFHGRIPGLSKVGLSVDFGPEVSFNSSGDFALSAGAVAPAMGFAAHYFF